MPGRAACRKAWDSAASSFSLIQTDCWSCVIRRQDVALLHTENGCQFLGDLRRLTRTLDFGRNSVDRIGADAGGQYVAVAVENISPLGVHHDLADSVLEGLLLVPGPFTSCSQARRRQNRMKITRMVKNRKVIRLRTSMFPLYKLRSPHYWGEAINRISFTLVTALMLQAAG